MVAKFNGKTPSAGKATKPNGKPSAQPVKKVESTYTKAKAKGGSAAIDPS